MRRYLLWLAAVAAVAGTAGYFVAALAAVEPDRIALTVSKFTFSSREIKLRKGKPVTFTLSSVDFVHGFSVPDFNVRKDTIPGKTVEVTFTPDRAGRFIFLCDNFCGDGHDQMAGVLVVTDD